MLTMDVFKQDAFSAVSLSAAVDKMDYVPDFLSNMPGLFEDDPVRSVEIWIEERSTGAVVLPFSPRGTAPHQTGGDQRKARAFSTLRFGDASRITASELLGIRGFGSEVNLKTLQEEVGRRQFKIKRNMQLTKEFHKFNCVTAGLVKDADGTTKYDWASELDQVVPADVNIALTTYDQNGGIRKTVNGIRRTIQKNLKGVGSAKQIIALCGDNFYDALTGNKEVRETYLNTSKAQSLQNDVGQEWESFKYANVTWINYRGTDDGSFGVNTDNCHFVPLGAGIFRWAMSPGEKMEHVGTMGQDVYSWIVTDKDRDSWADVEVYSYPLPVCTMPQALVKGVKT